MNAPERRPDRFEDLPIKEQVLGLKQEVDALKDSIFEDAKVKGYKVLQVQSWTKIFPVLANYNDALSQQEIISLTLQRRKILNDPEEVIVDAYFGMMSIRSSVRISYEVGVSKIQSEISESVNFLVKLEDDKPDPVSEATRLRILKDFLQFFSDLKDSRLINMRDGEAKNLNPNS